MSCDMFCFQCEQTAMGKGCTKVGVCGKTPEVSNLQDLLIHQLKIIGTLATKAIAKGEKLATEDYDNVSDWLFSTLTNVNFDETYFMNAILNANDLIKRLSVKAGENSAFYQAPNTLDAMLLESVKYGIEHGEHTDEDRRTLESLIILGLKGVAAYRHHAAAFGLRDEKIDKFILDALANTISADRNADTLLKYVMEVGKVNIDTMALLDSANTVNFGHPEPTKVFTGQVKGPFIVVSGHDLFDLHELLKQTEGTGVNIYTHSEMLPAHAYPELKKYKHLVGNFGGAWFEQQKEFDNIPGAILMTTNCLMKPKDSYKDRLFTANMVGWKDIKNIGGKVKDFTPVIEKAKELKGFSTDGDGKYITVGFARNAVLSHAEHVVSSVKKGDIKHFFLVGGCDGAKGERSYYRDFVEKTPKDSIILTLACGKYRFNDLDLGEVAGLPRLMDVGQCNDAYSAVKIALALSEAFGCSVNDLPLNLVLSWYEQKAVAILLSLLYLGIKGIYIGPSLPAFISPNILKFLVENFQLTPVSDPQADLDKMLKVN